MAHKAFTRLTPKTTALLLCDMQEKFRNTVTHFNQIVNVSNRMLKAARLLGIPVVATEQYPKGLGPTVPELGIKDANVPLFEKTCFSMMCNDVEEYLKTKTPSVKSVLLCGIETHACIFQTSMDLLERGYDVHLLADASSSRNPVDRLFAFRQLEKAGANLTTSECVILALLRDAAHPKFKDVQQLIKEKSPDSDLLFLMRSKQ